MLLKNGGKNWKSDSSKANKEVMSLYDLMTVGILAHLHFSGVIKHLTKKRDLAALKEKIEFFS